MFFMNIRPLMGPHNPIQYTDTATCESALGLVSIRSQPDREIVRFEQVLSHCGQIFHN